MGFVSKLVSAAVYTTFCGGCFYAWDMHFKWLQKVLKEMAEDNMRQRQQALWEKYLAENGTEK